MAAVDLVMMGRGVPVTQPARSVEFVWKNIEGTNKTDNPLSGLVFGDTAGQNMSILNPVGE
jgi:hypothetical protein